MDTKNQINPTCKACSLHLGASCVCLKGRGNAKGSLMIFSDYPDYFADRARRPYSLDVGKFLDWCMKRMSIDPDDVVYEYTLRCYAQKTLPTTKAGRYVCIQECNQYRFATIAKLRPKAIVVFGQVSLEAFTGRTRVKDNSDLVPIACNEGLVKKYVPHVWCGYSVQYSLMSPAASPNAFRTMWYAAKEAGFKPKINADVPPFVWPNILK